MIVEMETKVIPAAGGGFNAMWRLHSGMPWKTVRHDKGYGEAVVFADVAKAARCADWVMRENYRIAGFYALQNLLSIESQIR